MHSAVVLSHDWIAHELGHLEPWLADHGFSVTRVFREDAPALPPADLLIVLGSPGSAVAEACSPATTAEIEAVRDWVLADRPYLGICFGAQVLATAMGGRVDRLPVPFSGYVTLDLAPKAPAPLLGPWTVWHNDGITAPVDAELLGGLEHADLAFRTRRAWGLQPHVEVTADSLERMLVSLGASVADYGPVVEALRVDAEGNDARARDLLDAVWSDVSSA